MIKLQATGLLRLNSLRPLSLFSPSLINSGKILRSYSTSRKSTNFNLDLAGLLADLYVPPNNPPSWFTNPKQRWTILKRNLQTLGINTYAAIKLRKDIGRDLFMPLEWKELAIILYTRTNECFAKRDSQNLQKITSRWVYGPLSDRMKQLSSSHEYSWKLLKLNKRPKVISMLPLALPNEPLHYVQVVYRFDSMQRLSKLDLKTKEIDSQDRRVVDNIAFLFDVDKNPIEGRLIGSLFETPPQAPMPDANSMASSRAEAMRAMSVRGDIFRPEPEYMTIKSE